MSASLVGSEMCIRDSATAGGGAARDGSRGEGSNNSSRIPGWPTTALRRPCLLYTSDAADDM
eukprot:11929886-Alexandrium_andersonii.AAC.1